MGQLPRLDHVVFADTHGEMPETYAYLDYVRGVLEDAEIPLHVVSAGSLEHALTHIDGRGGNSTPPMHVLNDDGSKGRIQRYGCSHTYKREQIMRKIKHLCGGRGAWKTANVEQWIGFSLDEIGRMKSFPECRCGHSVRAHSGGRCATCDKETRRVRCEQFDPWVTNVWPLVDMRMRRGETIAWFARNGHPTPPRSACFFCPNQGNERWGNLRRHHPDLFERAVAIDVKARRGFEARGIVRGSMFLHGSLVPLTEADLRTSRELAADAGQGSLFDEDALAMDCSAGVCFT